MIANRAALQNRNGSSAGFQPAVSPICNRQTVENIRRARTFARFAGWKPCDTAGWKPALRGGLNCLEASPAGMPALPVTELLTAFTRANVAGPYIQTSS